LIAGATAIQVGTATFINPNAMVTLLAELKTFLKSHNFQNVSELVGSVRDEAAADAVVFMETAP
jgi:dihydroorotate dehydrogenase (NAD+) catalytic subunit